MTGGLASGFDLVVVLVLCPLKICAKDFLVGFSLLWEGFCAMSTTACMGAIMYLVFYGRGICDCYVNICFVVFLLHVPSWTLHPRY